jgi:NitT/TauT family transport system ATP-binding protein
VIINIQEGVKSIGRDRIEMMKIYARSFPLLVRHCFIPSLGPQLKAILLTAFPIALKSAILGEWFGAHDGIGRIINEYFYTFDMRSFYAVALFFLLSVGASAVILNRIAIIAFSRKRSKIKRTNASEPRAARPAPLTKEERAKTELLMTDVTFAYGSNVILRDFSFSLADSMPLILTGDSGIGKTTFARIASGLLAPQRGSVRVPNNMCLIFQEDVLLPHLDCFGNAILPALKKKETDGTAVALQALETCGLSEYIDYFPDELSGGMKKRLAFARALVFEPDFIILDEPFNKLHREARDELWQLFFSLFVRRGIPSIMITHFPEELDRFPGCVRMELRDGKFSER